VNARAHSVLQDSHQPLSLPLHLRWGLSKQVNKMLLQTKQTKKQ
jgi:hypothetical protein